MKSWTEIRRQRELHLLRGCEEQGGGQFLLRVRRVELRIIASWGGGWDHVSVSTAFRCPTWDEMCLVKGLFFRAEECVIEYHPPASRYVNDHPFVLHLWRPQHEAVPMPPLLLV